MNISIVVPVYNSEKSLMELNERLIGVLEGESYEIIFVDDASHDASREVIEALSRGNPQIRYIFFDRNYGQQAAIFAGLKKSRGERVITLDDDLQHLPEDIPMILEALEDCEGIFAFPEIKPHKGYRRLGSFMTHHLFNGLFKKDKALRISSYRGIKRSLVDRMIREEAAFVYISALMIQHSDSLKTIYHRQNQRKHGESNYNFRKLLSLYMKIIIYYGPWKGMRSNQPLYRIQREN
ncbi:MAG: hypothetical protein AVO33_05250 [delta proteobacterium ML8_F1]|nr:MAG: hypothetical protein AVO33_05250 [delta proteobacterium ML8_F1]